VQCKDDGLLDGLHHAPVAVEPSGLRFGGPIIYRGVFATGLFQCLYQRGPAHWAMLPSTLEWHLAAAVVGGPGFPIRRIALLAIGVLCAGATGNLENIAGTLRLPAGASGLVSESVLPMRTVCCACADQTTNIMLTASQMNLILRLLLRKAYIG